MSPEHSMIVGGGDHIHKFRPVGDLDSLRPLYLSVGFLNFHKEKKNQIITLWLLLFMDIVQIKPKFPGHSVTCGGRKTHEIYFIK